MQTVLVIEKNSTYRLYICELLKLEYCQVIEAIDGLTGLRMAKVFQPDLVFCGTNVLDVSEFEVLKFLRQDTATTQIPVVILLATQPDSRCYEEAMRAGATGFLDISLSTPKVIKKILQEL